MTLPPIPGQRQPTVGPQDYGQPTVGPQDYGQPYPGPQSYHGSPYLLAPQRASVEGVTGRVLLSLLAALVVAILGAALSGLGEDAMPFLARALLTFVLASLTFLGLATLLINHSAAPPVVRTTGFHLTSLILGYLGGVTLSTVVSIVWVGLVVLMSLAEQSAGYLFFALFLIGPTFFLLGTFIATPLVYRTRIRRAAGWITPVQPPSSPGTPWDAPTWDDTPR